MILYKYHQAKGDINKNIMIHYNHNTNKHKNIQLQKPKRHALAHYRHQQKSNKIKTLLIEVAITAAAAIILSAIYLTNN